MIATTRDRDSKRYACFPKALMRRCYYFYLINGKEREKRV